MSAGKLCTRVVVFASPTETVRTVADRMLENNVGAVVIVDEDRHPVGILTDRDIVLRCVAKDLNPVDTLVEKVMTKPVRTVGESTAIEDALRVMRTAGARRIVVTGDAGELAGILSVDDIIDLLASETEAIGDLLRTEAPVIA